MITAIHHSTHQFTVHSLYTTKYIHSYHKWDSPKVLFSNDINFKVQHLWVMLVIPYIRTEIISFYRDLKKNKVSILSAYTHTCTQHTVVGQGQNNYAKHLYSERWRIFSKYFTANMHYQPSTHPQTTVSQLPRTEPQVTAMYFRFSIIISLPPLGTNFYLVRMG